MATEVVVVVVFVVGVVVVGVVVGGVVVGVDDVGAVVVGVVVGAFGVNASKIWRCRKKCAKAIDGELKATHESKQKPTFNRRMCHNLHRQCRLSELDKSSA